MPPDPLEATFVHAAGGDLRCEVERSRDPRSVDHVWITMQTGERSPYVVSINTRSLHNERAGFDSRVRRGTLRGAWKTLPPRCIEACAGFDYAPIESEANIFFEYCDRPEMEHFFLQATRRACLLEVWGVPYSWPSAGIHQIHSRRASCAVTRDIHGRDGALRFYFGDDHSSLLVLLKFCGQP